MSDHRDRCPRYKTGKFSGLMEIMNPTAPCWFCEANARARYMSWMPVLPRLRAWLEDGEDLLPGDWSDLHFHFADSLPHGVMTGDTGTIDEWFADHPERMDEFISDIEGWCIQEAA